MTSIRDTLSHLDTGLLSLVFTIRNQLKSDLALHHAEGRLLPHQVDIVGQGVDVGRTTPRLGRLWLLSSYCLQNLQVHESRAHCRTRNAKVSNDLFLRSTTTTLDQRRNDVQVEAVSRVDCHAGHKAPDLVVDFRLSINEGNGQSQLRQLLGKSSSDFRLRTDTHLALSVELTINSLAKPSDESTHVDDLLHIL